MESPLVSVCIPAYNNADTILETIQSVLTQTYQNLELIVVDDRSTDDTYQVVKTFAKQAGDDRLHLYQNEKNLGMAGNWNHCMELCKGDFIKLLCADDLIHETLLAREVEIMERYPEANLVQTDTRFVDMHGKTTGFYKRYHAHGVVDGKKACRFSVFTRDYLGAHILCLNNSYTSFFLKLFGFSSKKCVTFYTFWRILSLKAAEDLLCGLPELNT